MYCVNCGVELQKGVSACPLCGTRVYHPEIQEKPDAPEIGFDDFRKLIDMNNRADELANIAMDELR